MAAEDDFDEFQAAPPCAAPSGLDSSRTCVGNVLRSREPLPADLFCSEQTEDDDWGDFSEVAANGTTGSHLQPLWQQEGAAQPPPPPPPPGSLSEQGDFLAKGDAVWYFDGRSGSWVEAKVASIDRTITPPSYGVQLRSGAIRETELHRLQPRSAGAPPPSAPAQAASAPAPAQAPAAPAVRAPSTAAVANGHHGLAAAPHSLTPGLRPQADGGDDAAGDFGDFAAAPQPPPPAAIAPSRAGLLAVAPPPAASPTAAPPVVRPASPPAPGSPGLARRLSSGSSSPALDRFRTFLHAAAPEVADRLAADERQQQGAAREEADEFGDFADAGVPPPPLPQHVQQQGASPGGVQRSAPLSLDLFGGEAVEDAPLELTPAPALPPAGNGAAAAALTTQRPLEQAVSPEGPRASLPSHPDPPSTMRDPAGRLVAVDHAGSFVRQPPAAARPPSPPPPDQAAYGGWEGGDDAFDDAFDDFVGAETAGQEREPEGVPQPQPQRSPSPPRAPPPAGVQRGSALPEDLFAAAAQGDEEAEGDERLDAEPGKPGEPSAAQEDAPGAASAVQRTPQPSNSAGGHVQASGAADAAAGAAVPSGGCPSSGDDDGFEEFVTAADTAADAAPHAPPATATAAHGLQDGGAASPPEAVGGAQRVAPLPLDMFGGEAAEDAPLELGPAAAAPESHAGIEQPATALEPASPQIEAQVRTPSAAAEAAAGVEPVEAVAEEAAQPAAAADAEGQPGTAWAAWAEAPSDGWAAEAGGTGPQALVAAAGWVDVAGGRQVAADDRQGSGGAAAGLHARDSPPAAARASLLAVAPAEGAAEDPASCLEPAGGALLAAAAGEPLHAGHGAGSQGSSSAAAASPSSWQQLGGGMLPRALSAPGAAALTPDAAPVTEYGQAWARLLQAASHLLQASAAVWCEATASGAGRRQLGSGEARAHLAACAQLYCAAGMVRLAAQQLGLFGLVPELQEAWAQADMAWRCSPPPQPSAEGGGDAAETHAPADTQQAQAAEQAGEQPYGEACLSAHRAWAAAGEGADGGCGDAAAVLQLLEGAPQLLQQLDLDQYPRMLEWSDGLCGLTLLPLSLFEGHVPVQAWAQGRPCLVPLANLWTRRVSHTPPQLD